MKNLKKVIKHNKSEYILGTSDSKNKQNSQQINKNSVIENNNIIDVSGDTKENTIGSHSHKQNLFLKKSLNLNNLGQNNSQQNFSSNFMSHNQSPSFSQHNNLFKSQVPSPKMQQESKTSLDQILNSKLLNMNKQQLFQKNNSQNLQSQQNSFQNFELQAPVILNKLIDEDNEGDQSGEQYNNNNIYINKEQINSLDFDIIINLCEARCNDLRISFIANQLNRFAEKIKSNCRNKIFNMQEQGFSIHSAEIIAFICRFNNNFTRYVLAKNNLSDMGTLKIIEGLRENFNIVHLDLSNNNLSGKGMQIVFEFLETNYTIISLNISSSDGFNRNKFTQSAAKALNKMLKQNNILQFLNLENTSLGNQGVMTIQKGLFMNTNLVYLNLGTNHLDQDCASYISNFLKGSQIQQLDLSNNKLGDISIESINKIFTPGKYMYLKDLNLSNIGLTSHGLIILCKAIASSNYLQKLYVDYSYFQDERFQQFGQFIADNNSLTVLSLKKCNINDDGINFLAQGLSNNKTLQELYLSQNFLNEQGVYKLAETLKFDKTKIKKIELYKCGITDSGGTALAKAIQQNKNLAHLDLRHNMLGDESGSFLIEALKQNKYILSLSVEKNMIRMDYVTEINKSIQLNNYFHRQQQMPTLIGKMHDMNHFDIKAEDLVAKKQEIINKEDVNEKEIVRLEQTFIQEQVKFQQSNQKLEQKLESQKIEFSELIEKSKNQEKTQSQKISENEQKIQILQKQFLQFKDKEIVFLREELRNLKEEVLRKKLLQHNNLAQIKIKLRESEQQKNHSFMQFESFKRHIEEKKNNNKLLLEEIKVQEMREQYQKKPTKKFTVIIPNDNQTDQNSPTKLPNQKQPQEQKQKNQQQKTKKTEKKANK